MIVCCLHSRSSSESSSVAGSSSSATRSSRSRSRSRSPPPKTIHVGNLTPNVTKDHLLEIFGEVPVLEWFGVSWCLFQYGKIKKVDRPSNKGMEGHSLKEFAYIEFARGEDADNAVAHMSSGWIDGKMITCEPVLKPDQASSKRNFTITWGFLKFRGFFKKPKEIKNKIFGWFLCVFFLKKNKKCKRGFEEKMLKGNLKFERIFISTITSLGICFGPFLKISIFGVEMHHFWHFFFKKKVKEDFWAFLGVQRVGRRETVLPG